MSEEMGWVSLAGLWGFILGWFVREWVQWLLPTHSDVGVQIIAAMVTKLRDSRQFVGPKAELTVSQEMELQGDHFTLSMSLTEKTAV